MPPILCGTHRQDLMARAVQCLGCRDDIQIKLARPFLYIVARHVRAAREAQIAGATRGELNARLEELRGAADTVLQKLSDRETVQALSIIGTVPHGLEKDTAELVELAAKAQEKLDLKGRHGSDRAAHSFVLHAQPLLTIYLTRLYEACSGKRPPIGETHGTTFHELLTLVWEVATGEFQEKGWERHISAAKRDFKVPKDENLAHEPVGITGNGPGTPTTIFDAHMKASDLAQAFSERVDRRRQARIRQ